MEKKGRTLVMVGKSNVTYKNKERKRKGEMNENDAKDYRETGVC